MLKKSKDVLDPQSWCGLNRPDKKETEVDAVIFGIPFDGGVSYRGGAAQAPEVLRANTKHSTPSTERLYYYDSFEELEAAHPDARFHLLSTHAEASFAEAQFLPGDFLVFGKETAGLGQELLSRRSSDAIRIPMRKGLRSLNLSNSVAIVVYEGLRQNGYAGLV